MFGHHYRNLDDKNRVIVPSKFRNKLGNTLYITLGPDKILELRDSKSFQFFSNKLLSNNMLNANARKFARILLGNSVESNVDKQGRISIPSTLLKAAHIANDELVFVGVGTKVEVLGKTQFEKLHTNIDNANTIDDLAKKLLIDGEVL